MGNYSKYHVAPKWERIRDDIVFASKMEAKRYDQLKLLEKAGEIQELQLQPRFTLLPAFERHGIKYKAIVYVADFAYYDCKTKKRVCEDTKGYETAIFKLKRKLFAYHHNMELRIIYEV